MIYMMLSLSLCVCVYIYICTPIHLALNECTRRGQTTRVAIDATDFFYILSILHMKPSTLKGNMHSFDPPKSIPHIFAYFPITVLLY